MSANGLPYVHVCVVYVSVRDCDCEWVWVCVIVSVSECACAWVCPRPRTKWGRSYLWQMKRLNVTVTWCVAVVWKRNVMAHAQKPDLVFQRNGRLDLYRRRCQFSRLLAAEVCASAVVMLDRSRSDTVESCWLPTPFASFPFTSPPVRRRVPSDSVSILPLLAWIGEARAGVCPVLAEISVVSRCLRE